MPLSSSSEFSRAEQGQIQFNEAAKEVLEKRTTQFQRVRNAVFRRLTTADIPAIEESYRRETISADAIHDIARLALGEVEEGQIRFVKGFIKDYMSRGKIVGAFDEPHGVYPSYKEQLDSLDAPPQRGHAQFMGYGLFDRASQALLAHMTWEQTPKVPELPFQKRMLQYLTHGVSGEHVTLLTLHHPKFFLEQANCIVRIELIIRDARYAAERLWAKCMRKIRELNPSLRLVMFERMNDLLMYRVREFENDDMVTPIHDQIPIHFTSNLGKNMRSEAFTTERECADYALDYSAQGPLFRREEGKATYEINARYMMKWGFLDEVDAASWKLWNHTQLSFADRTEDVEE